MKTEKTETELAIDIAQELIMIMHERAAMYGSNEHKTAQIMLILYPDYSPKTVYEVAQYKFIMYIIDKICRYVKGGHKDSAMDIAGYALRLAALQINK
jgi:hypothetical protein